MNDLTHQIYSTALDADTWPDLLLEGINQFNLSNQNSEASKDIRSHFSLAMEIKGKKDDSITKSALIEASLSFLPVAIFHRYSSNDRVTLMPLNQRARALEVNVKERIHLFSEQIQKYDNADRERLNTENLKINKTNYFFVEFLVNKIEDKGINSLVLVFFGVQSLLKDSQLYHLWNLSKKEIYICQRLLIGQSLNNIADNSSRSIHTVRSQVKSIFKKSGSHSQSDLIRQFFSTPLSINSQLEKTIGIKETPLASHLFKLKDGRNICWAEHGDPNGIPVILCHTMHQSRLTQHSDVNFTANMKIRVITPDRPGYGNSESNKNYSPYFWGNDLKELLDHLKLDKVCLLGVGVGVVFALNAAEILGTKIIRTLCVNPPNFINKTPSFSYSNPLRMAAGKMAKQTPWLLEKIIQLVGRDIFLKEPSKLLSEFYPCSSENDRAVLQDKQFRELLISDFQESNKQGFGKALVYELHYLFNNPRIFDPSKIEAPVAMWNKTDCENPSAKRIKDFSLEFKKGSNKCVVTDDDFIIFHEWKNYLKVVAFG